MDNSGTPPDWLPPKLGEWLAGISDDTPWLLPGFLPLAGLGLISGPQKLAFKTFLADTIGLLVSTGKHHSLLKPTTSGPVLYIEEEGVTGDTRDRLRAVGNGIGVNADEAEIYYAFRQRVKLDSDFWVKRLKAVVDHIKPTLVILDALVYLHGADENKTNEMKPVVELIQDLRERGATVLCLAHLNSGGSDDSKDIDEQVRGSRIVVNAYDSHLALRRKSRQEKYIRMYARHRGAPEKEYKVLWTLENDDEEQRLVTAFPTFILVDDDVELANRIDKLARELDSRVGYSRAQIQQLWDMNAKSTKRYLEAGMDSGRILQKGKVFFSIPHGSNQ